MAKYMKKPLIIEADLFSLGMEDGFSYYRKKESGLVVDGEQDLIFIGYFPIGSEDTPTIPTLKRPAIKTPKGWHEVKNGEHYIIKGLKGDRYVLTKETFENAYVPYLGGFYYEEEGFEEHE